MNEVHRMVYVGKSVRTFFFTRPALGLVSVELSAVACALKW